MTTTAVRIWCPDWCTVPERTHLDDLESWEGCVIHSSDDFGRIRGEDYALTMIGLPDGTPTPEETHHAEVMCIAGGGELIHPDQMELHALALLELVTRARASRQERQR
ncbi:hypothetical protein [uncultured Nocardioides sp.]|uniref:hypothetical protein n=1 Tax=uncultured Nocardioides sp. TaxID=198441 RepID=UPI00261D82AA|nr:hypothetical protein [uncultured Nocardioides sp.]